LRCFPHCGISPVAGRCRHHVPAIRPARPRSGSRAGPSAALDTALGRVRDVRDPRSFVLRNATRTNAPLGLIGNHLNGDDVHSRYPHPPVRDRRRAGRPDRPTTQQLRPHAQRRALPRVTPSGTERNPLRCATISHETPHFVDAMSTPKAVRGSPPSLLEPSRLRRRSVSPSPAALGAHPSSTGSPGRARYSSPHSCTRSADRPCAASATWWPACL
jgi:hypothetical protein